jgi:uncharacterized protein (DUF2141 family)
MLLNHFILGFCFLFGLFAQNNSNHVTLSVRVENIKAQNGKTIRIGIDKKNEFMKNDEPFKYALVRAYKNYVEYEFKLPKGEYAVSVYHDLNGNEELDKNLFGAPKEPYGFSQNYVPRFRAPRFDEVKIPLANDKKINIKLIHP